MEITVLYIKILGSGPSYNTFCGNNFFNVLPNLNGEVKICNLIVIFAKLKFVNHLEKEVFVLLDMNSDYDFDPDPDLCHFSI